jgi:hypothetical protein
MIKPARVETFTEGRFRLGRQLGAGSSGVVYEAFDERAQTPVALKVMRYEGAEQQQRLLREVEVLRGIAHPNLLRIGELLRADSGLFLSMELVTGQDFMAHVRPAERLDEQRLRAALAQLASGLLALHATGRVHRDVKPTNVLVTDAGRTVLLDFGLMSDPSNDNDPTPVVVGTVSHMAPEQASGRSVGPEADWYSVGVMLYEALTGQLPFSGVPLQVLLDKQQSDPAAPHQLVAGVPRDLSELCSELLRFEPLRRPSGRAVLRRLCGDASASASNHTLVTLLCGRDAECAEVERLLGEVRQGRVACLSLCGEPGSGKSRTLAALCERAREAGATVLFARPAPHRPYNAIEPLAERLAQLLGEEPEGSEPIVHGATLKRMLVALEGAPHLAAGPETPDAQELRGRMFAAARELFGRLSAGRLLVLAIDDVDEADADSLALLGAMLRTPSAPPLLLVLTRTAAAMQSLVDERALVERHLHPLDPTAMRVLSRELLRMAGRGELTEQIAAQSGGSPLLAEELVRVAMLEGDVAGLSSLADTLPRRVAGLSPLALSALRLLAVCPGPLRLELLGQLLGIEGSEVARLGSLLALLGLAQLSSGPDGELLGLAHRAFRAPLLAALPEAELGQLHLSVCRGLELGTRSELDLLAHHYAAAGVPARVGAAALSAAERAERALAFERAGRLFEAAVAFLPDGSAEQRAARVRAGRALSHAGRGVEAAVQYANARHGANAAEALELGKRAAQQLFFAGQIREGERVLRATLATASVGYPRSPWSAMLRWVFDLVRLKLRGLGFRKHDASQLPAHLLTRIDTCWHAGLVLAIADTTRGNAFMLRSLLAALRAGEVYRVVRGLALHAGFVSSGGARGQAQSEVLLARAESLARAEGLPPHAGAVVLGTRGQARFLDGRFAEALAMCSQAEKVFRDQCAEVPWELNAVRMWSARSLQYMGDFHELGARLPLLLEECRQRGDLYGEVSLMVSVAPHLLLAQNRPAEAREHVREAQQRWHAEGFHVQHYHALLGGVAIALYEGQAVEAYALARELLAGTSRSLLGRVEFVRVMSSVSVGNAALTLLAADRGARHLRRIARKHARALASGRTRWAAPYGQVLLAGLAWLDGRQREAQVLLHAAASGYETATMKLHAAAVRRRLGALVGGEQGQALVSSADAIFARQGVCDAERMARVLVPVFAPLRDLDP